MGGNLCNGSPAADSVPALIAAGAKATIVGPKGRRDVPVEDVMLAPRKLSLTKGEIIASFLLPRQAGAHGRCLSALHPAHRDGHRGRGLRRVPHARCQGNVHGGRASRSGAVAARPLLVAPAAAALIGSKVDDAALQKLAAAASAACRPIDDKRGTKEYRIKVAGVLARRAAQIALERARKG